MAAPRPQRFPLDAAWPLVLRDLGVDARAVLRRAALPEDLLNRGGPGLEATDYFRLWEALEAEFGDGNLPLRLATEMRSEAFSPSIFAALCSQNFASAARRIATYKRLCAPMELRITEDDAQLRLELDWLEEGLQTPVSLAAFELAFFVQLFRMATREPIVPLAVQTPRPPEPASEFEAYFGVPIERRPQHALVFRRADVHRPFLTANESMWEFFEPSLRQRLADLDADSSFGARVRAVLVEGLPAGECSVDEVARRLHVSRRTLQRRLRHEDLTFQGLLNATREDLARHYLQRTELSGAEISYLLGFEDPNSFFRAFHTWTGMTTEQLRTAN